MKLRFDPQTPLYDSEKRAWRMDQCAELLDLLLSRAKPLVVFVHGRGKEPNKSLNGATWVKGLAVPKIELGYDVSVLMFNWDSAFPGLKFRDRTRALGKTEAAGAQLSELVGNIATYFNAHPDKQRPALLVHSMGSVVVQKAVENGLWPGAARVFSQVVLSEPDSDDVGHSGWLSRLADNEQVYVTWNADDKVLRRATDSRPAGSRPLGLGTTQPLAPNCSYIDLTGMGAIGSEEDDDHEVFGKSAMNGQVYVCKFFEDALRGRKISLDLGVNVQSVDRDVVYHLASKFDPSAPCLKVPKLPRRR